MTELRRIRTTARAASVKRKEVASAVKEIVGERTLGISVDKIRNLDRRLARRRVRTRSK
jgi:hypothetical protein